MFKSYIHIETPTIGKIWLLFFAFVLSCNGTTESKQSNFKIIYFIPQESNYKYSGVTFSYNKRLYRPTLIATYQKQVLSEFSVLKSEGFLQYSKTEINADTLLLHYLNLPKERSLKISNSYLSDNNKIVAIHQQLNDSIFTITNDTLILYTIEPES